MGELRTRTGDAEPRLSKNDFGPADALLDARRARLGAGRRQRRAAQCQSAAAHRARPAERGADHARGHHGQVPAREAAQCIGSKHTEIMFTIQEALDIIPQVVYATGTFDITTIRASIPQFLLMKYIAENTDFKVCLNGDGADEIEMGYLYFYLAYIIV